jgi:hypothetical protein
MLTKYDNHKLRRKKMEKVKKTVGRKENLVCIILTISLCVPLVLIGGCESRAQTGGLAGAGIGALAGQAIGGSTSATLIGAGIGAGAGYIIGNEQDKKAAKTYDMNKSTPLTGTKWKIIRLVDPEAPEYTAIFAEFKSNGELVTTIHEPGGTQTVTEERYRIVGDTLIINKPGYIINAKYKVSGKQLTIDCLEFHAVLQRI